MALPNPRPGFFKAALNTLHTNAVASVVLSYSLDLEALRITVGVGRRQALRVEADLGYGRFVLPIMHRRS